MIFNLDRLVRMNRYASAKATLQLVVTELNRGDEASHALWAILSALRGPDVLGASSIKSRTTARIRSAIGLKWQSYAFTSDGPVDVAGIKEDTVGHHFAQHIGDAKNALEALGYVKSRSAELDQALKDLDKL